MSTNDPIAIPENPGQDVGWSAALRDILAERRRQVEAEGWTPEHDDTHRLGEMARAAASYAMNSAGHVGWAHGLWPWDRVFRKFGDPRRDLVKAGALIAAEIDRIDRMPAAPAPRQDGEPEVGA